ncbi:MAG: Dabb family protein [Xanthomonadales bacterium]|nr:Dabb family protein [Xanthomonadales bacterium]
MTILHMVWLKAPKGVSDANMEDLLEDIRCMKSIPSVINIVAGKNLKNTDHGYEYGVLMTYADKVAQQLYIKHPLHEKVRDQIKAMGVGMMGLDFEH